MSGILRDLLDAEEPIFSLSLRQLERASGEQGRDVQLIGDIIQKMRYATGQLGLDPGDTTGPELYAAQMSRVERDNIRLAGLLGSDNADDITVMAELILKKAKTTTQTTVWVLKRAVAKELLKNMPPKKLMKQLGHRSIDALIKHEPIDELYLGLRFSEGEVWLNKFNEQFRTVRPSDFESRELSFALLDVEKYGDTAKSYIDDRLHAVLHSKELGVVGLLPLPQRGFRGVTLKNLALLMHYINEVKLYSTFFKLKQVEANFGELVATTLSADPPTASQMAGQYVHWRVIQRYFGELDDEAKTVALQPHIQPEDLVWQKTEDALALIDPELGFWRGQSYVGKVYDELPLTFNLLDATINYSRRLSYDKRHFKHFRNSLWNEIFVRYMGSNNLSQQVLSRLDTNEIAPEDLKFAY